MKPVAPASHIDRTIRLLKEYWEATPEMSFNQIIYQLQHNFNHVHYGKYTVSRNEETMENIIDLRRASDKLFKDFLREEVKKIEENKKQEVLRQFGVKVSDQNGVKYSDTEILDELLIKLANFK